MHISHIIDLKMDPVHFSETSITTYQATRFSS